MIESSTMTPPLTYNLMPFADCYKLTMPLHKSNHVTKDNKNEYEDDNNDDKIRPQIYLKNSCTINIYIKN